MTISVCGTNEQKSKNKTLKKLKNMRSDEDLLRRKRKF